MIDFDFQAGCKTEALIVTERREGHTRGYVFCDREAYEAVGVGIAQRYVVWCFDAVDDGDRTVTFWGHYFDDKDEAMSDLLTRAGVTPFEGVTV